MSTKVHRVKAMVFPVVTCGCESWTIKGWVLNNWCFWTAVLEKTLESPLDCKRIQPVHPKGNQTWIFTGRADAEAEALKLWPPDAKSGLIRKDSDAGKDWRQEEKGMTKEEMVGRHHWHNGQEFEQAAVHAVAESQHDWVTEQQQKGKRIWKRKYSRITVLCTWN